MNIRDFLFDEMKKDISLYALVTAFEISNVDIEEPILIDCIKEPENDTFFRRLGMVSDYYIRLHDRTNGGKGIYVSDELLDRYDSYVDFINDREHMKRV